MDLKAITETVKKDFEAVDTLIIEQLNSHTPLIGQIGEYLIMSGGKRLRPLIALVCAKAANYQGRDHIEVAAIIELLHTATLLHDDVVDESHMRRGKRTANALWGNASSILVGDFLISRAFQMVTALENPGVLKILSDATNVIAEGEVMQLVNCKDPNTTEERYMAIIRHKTAKLFEAAAKCSAVLAGMPLPQEQAIATYAMHLGSAFQLADDILDYTGSAEEMGKNVGDDLAEGKPTLPLIIAMRHGSPAQTGMISDAIRTGALDKLDEINKTVLSVGALDYCSKIAYTEAEKAVAALNIIEDSEPKDALIALAMLAVNRNH